MAGSFLRHPSCTCSFGIEKSQCQLRMIALLSFHIKSKTSYWLLVFSDNSDQLKMPCPIYPITLRMLETYSRLGSQKTYPLPPPVWISPGHVYMYFAVHCTSERTSKVLVLFVSGNSEEPLGSEM